MSERDLHSSLRTSVVGSDSGSGVELTLARLQWGKDDVAFSIHASPRSFSLSGQQTSDLLSSSGISTNGMPIPKWGWILPMGA
ncbi:MAG TPA: hypothetical protein VFJ58_02795 [Armatimonadota bacterium]|nr:hypothetical protein [Armatimonadota bacterium]